MAVTKIDVVVLQCDQGMGTLVKIYEDAKLSQLVLIDLGSDEKVFAADAVNFVNDALTEMKNDGKTPGIWQLIVSHQDYDHWSLLEDLFLPGGTARPITLGRILYGGVDWADRASGVLTKIATEYKCGAPVPLSGIHYSAYATPGTIVDLLTVGDAVRISTLVVNTPSRRKAPDLRRNGSSAVMTVRFAGQVCIIPGDATSETVGSINATLTDWANAGQANPLRPCYLLGVPHHGALRTLADNFTSKNPRLDIARAFALNTQAERVAASAGYTSDYLHPYKAVIQLLGYAAGSAAGSHNYVWWDESIGYWREISATTQNVFTTVTKLDPPVGRQSWYFTISATGETSFRPFHHSAPPRPAPGPLAARPAAARP